MSIDVSCSRCRKELNCPGALVFSPPGEHYCRDYNVKKLHICSDCWTKLIEWIELPNIEADYGDEW